MAETSSSRFVRSASHWGAFWAEVEGERVVGVKPFEKDLSPSPLIESIVTAVHSESRVDRPYVRQGYLEHGKDSDGSGRGAEPFVAVDWDTALDLVAGEVARVKEEHGNDSIFAGSYGWSSAGRLHHAKSALHRFVNLYGGATQQVGTYSTAAMATILPHVVGQTVASSGRWTSWSSIAQDTRLIVAFGGMPTKNMQVEGGCAGEHASEAWLKRLAEANVEVVCIGPVRTDAAEFLNPEWLHPRPGSDTAIMLGLAHTIFVEGLHDRDFLDHYTTGFERFRPYLMGEADGQPKDAAWAARLSGLDQETIRGLARRMASNRTLITTTWSLQRGDHGEQPFWMTIVLAAMLGQIGIPGGGFGFGYGSVNRIGNPAGPVPMLERPFGANPTGSIIPVARLADMLLAPGSTIDFDGKRITFPDIRLIYWCGGNPFHHHQDLNRLIEAWRRPETIVVNEVYWTAGARHADIVLPATTTLERNDIASSGGRFIFAMHQAIPPRGEARNDFDIFAALAQRLGFEDAYTEGRGEMDWLRHLYDVSRQQAAQHGIERPDFATFWKDGYVEAPEPPPFVLMADFRADPEAHRLDTPSGRIEIFSETIESFGYDDCPGHPAWMEPIEWLGAEKAGAYPIHMISNQPRHRLHGQMDNGAIAQAAKVAGREPIWIHPDDAAGRGIEQGDVVRVFNDRGQCLTGAVLTDAVRPGVVQLYTGAWYDPLEPGRIGSLDKHGNPNVLTLDKGTSRLAQGPSALSVLVEIEKWLGDAPDVTIFSRPALATP